MQRILILDDDVKLLQTISDFFKTKPYLIDKTSSVRRAEQLLTNNVFDLLVSERVLSEVDHLSWLQSVRKRCAGMRILICSRQRMVEQRVEALRCSDDFLSKPFNLLELGLRIDNLLGFERKTLLLSDSFLAWSATKYSLRPQEVRILECLWHHRNMIVSYDGILSYVWGMREPLPSALSISVYIRRIRMKLADPNLSIQTVSGRGFRLIFKDQKCSVR